MGTVSITVSFFIFISFIYIYMFNQCIVNLQCCVSSGVRQSDSYICMNIYTYLFSDFFSIIDYYKMLNIVPCAVR